MMAHLLRADAPADLRLLVMAAGSLVPPDSGGTFMTISAPGRAGHIFGPVGVADIADIRATLAAYRDTCQGWVSGTQQCGALWHRLMARVPPLD